MYHGFVFTTFKHLSLPFLFMFVLEVDPAAHPQVCQFFGDPEAVQLELFEQRSWGN